MRGGTGLRRVMAQERNVMNAKKVDCRKNINGETCLYISYI